MPTVVFRGTRDEAVELVRLLPQLLSGRVPDTLGVTRAVWFRLANAVLSQVYQEFITLSRRGVSRDGRQWAELAPATIARRLYKEIRAQRRKRRKQRGKPAPDQPHAGQFDIGRDTARMLRSLAAGVEDRPPANPETVVEVNGPTLLVGSNVPYLEWFHRGRPGKQPARPVVPADGLIPEAWLPAMYAAALRGLTAALMYLMTRGRPS